MASSPKMIAGELLPAASPGADLVNAIANLARQDHYKVEFVPLPKEALGLGVNVPTPHVALVGTTDGIEIRPITEAIESARGKPYQRKGTASVTTLASFIALVKRHKIGDETAIFADINWQLPTLTAVIDYHRPRTGDGRSEQSAFEDPGARFGRHRVHYAYPLSDAWKAWVAANKKPMDQVDFATFLEEHISELAAPETAERTLWESDLKARFATPAELLELSRGLEVTVGHQVKSRIKLQTGETQMLFETRMGDASGAELVVPGLFLLAVAPFRRGEQIRIPVRLRFRAGGGGITWFFEMLNPDKYIDERLVDDAGIVEAETGIAVIAGSPETPA